MAWLLNQDTNTDITFTVEGFHLGTTIAKAYTKNTLGDIVEVEFKIFVDRPKAPVDMVVNWDDDLNIRDGRPDDIVVQLYRKVPGGQPEKVGTPVTVSGGTNDPSWTHSFGPQYTIDMQEQPYEYFVLWEEGHPNYDTEHQGLVINNELVLVPAVGNKYWNIFGSGYDKPKDLLIHLYRNGIYFDQQVITGSETATRWGFSFDDTLGYDKYGAPYVYTVDEPQPPPDMRVNISGMNVTNTYGPDIRVIKIDARTKERLPGADFTLRQLSVVNPADRWDYDESAVTDENGEIHFRNIPMGSYVVFETEAPEGYAINPIRRSIVINGSRSLHSVTITNSRNVLGAYDEELQGVGSANVGLCPE